MPEICICHPRLGGRTVSTIGRVRLGSGTLGGIGRCGSEIEGGACVFKLEGITTPVVNFRLVDKLIAGLIVGFFGPIFASESGAVESISFEAYWGVEYAPEFK